MNPFEDKFWYELGTKEGLPGEPTVHSEVFRLAEQIERDQNNLREAWKKYARAYSNREEVGLDWNLEGNRELDQSFVTENVVKSVIDTAASIIAKNRVRVRVLTNGSDFTEQRRAKRLEKFVYGEMRAKRSWELGPLIFRDACIFGTGVAKIFGGTDDQICLERRLISDILVDEKTCIDGDPRELFERRVYDKKVLAGMFPKYSEEILNSSSDTWSEKQLPKGKIVVIEGWRLPSPGEKGRHVICIKDCTLVSDDWERSEFPFVFFRWDGLPISGFYGLGLARDLYGYQQRINQLNLFIERCQDLIAVPRVFVDMASKVLKVQLDNKIGAVIPYRGKPPTFFTPQALNAEIYNYKEQLKAAAFEFAGISQLSAQSLKPAGLESAVALREYTDIEMNRFVIQSQRYERLFTELGEHVINCAKELFDSGKEVSAKFPNKSVIELIDWSDVDLDRDRFELDIQPASLLSMSPSARLQAVTELAQVGQLDKAEIRSLLNHPDLEASNDIGTADFKMCQMIEEKLLDGEFPTVEPFFNFDLMLRRVQLLYQWVQTEYTDVPDEVLANMRDFTSQLKTQQEQSVAMAAPAGPLDPAAAAGQQPIAGGVAGSDVISNLAGPIGPS